MFSSTRVLPTRHVNHPQCLKKAGFPVFFLSPFSPNLDGGSVYTAVIPVMAVRTEKETHGWKQAISGRPLGVPYSVGHNIVLHKGPGRK